MKTKLAVALLSASVILAACSQEAPKNEAQNDLMKLQKIMPMVYKGLNIEMESYLEEDVLTVKVNVRNKSEQSIPLHYEKDRFATVSFTTGEEVVQEVMVPIEVDSIASQEVLSFETTYILPNVDKEYVVKTALNLQDGESWRYQEEELIEVEAVRKEKQQELVFLPKEKVTYVYENKRNEVISQKEETFLHFKDGFVQSVDSALGTKIYYVDQKGISLAYKDETTDKVNKIGKVDYTKQLLLAFPLKVGTNWELDGVHYEITALDQVIQTPFETFRDAVEVTSEFGTGVRYYYQKDIGLLEVQVKNGDKWEVTTKLVDKK